MLCSLLCPTVISRPFSFSIQASLMFTKQDVAIRHLFHFRETGGGDLSDEAFSPYALATFFLFYILMVRRVIIILILSLIKLGPFGTAR